MKIYSLRKIILLFLYAIPMCLFAQDKPEPVSSAFEHGLLINNQTVTNPLKNSLDVVIQHRFGAIDQPHDMYGIYAPSNIRLYIGYGITKDLSVGIGSTKSNELYDFSWKYTLLKQMTSGMPVTISYFGNVANSAKKDLLNQDNQGAYADRLSYFNEIMIARRFNSHLSLQVGGYCAYYNMIDSASFNGKHLFYGVSAIGRYKFSPQSSILVEYDLPLNVSDIPLISRPKQNIGIGFEVSTGNHQFQIFFCNANGILAQESRVFTQYPADNLWFKGPAWILGFNITRNWGFNK